MPQQLSPSSLGSLYTHPRIFKKSPLFLDGLTRCQHWKSVLQIATAFPHSYDKCITEKTILRFTRVSRCHV